MSTDGASSNDMCLHTLEPIREPFVFLGVCSVAVATLLGVPQALKIIRRRSARGVSFTTLGLGNIGGFLYVLNMYILHYDQILLAGSPFRNFQTWAEAQPHMLFIWVELANTLSLLMITPVAYAYLEDEPHAVVLDIPIVGMKIDWGMKESVRYGIAAQVLVLAGAWVPSLWILSREGRCEPLAAYANILGIVVALIICGKFIPQVRESLGNKGSKSLSYVTYGLDIVAGIVALLQKLFITHERLSTWVPPLFLHSLEAYVLGTNYYYDKKKFAEVTERRERDAEDGERAEYGSDEERVQSERLLQRGSQDRSAARVASPAGVKSEKKSTFSTMLDIFL
jgi:uncharacterized protein with PQ loop repeat